MPLRHVISFFLAAWITASAGPSSWSEKIKDLCSGTAGAEACLSACFPLITPYLKIPNVPFTPADSAGLKRIQLFFLGAFQRASDSLRMQPDRLAQWSTVYGNFISMFPDEESVPALHLNHAVYMTEAGYLDSAQQAYARVLKIFDGSTRFGAEALFYSAQIHYRKSEFEQALLKYERIRSTVFIPVDRDGLVTRAAECRFRLMETALRKKDTAAAFTYIRKMLSGPLPALFRDSVLFHRAEMEIHLEDTAAACRTLESVIKSRNRSHDIYFSSLFNGLVFGCTARLKLNGRGSRFQSRAREVISGSREPYRQRLVFNMMLEDIVRRQDAMSIDSLLRFPYTHGLPRDSLAGDILFLLRNAAVPEFQNTLLDRLKKSRTSTDENLKSASGRLSSEIALYEHYYDYLAGKKPGRPEMEEAFSSAWERSLLFFLRGMHYIGQYEAGPGRKASLIDSIQSSLTMVGKMNTELAFTAARELLDFYRGISEQGINGLIPSYQQLGETLISLQYGMKALQIIDKSASWYENLKNQGLHSRTKEEHVRIRSEAEAAALENRLNWETVSVSMAGICAQPVNLHREIAFELLVKEIRGLFESDPAPSKEGVQAVIASCLAWAHLQVAEPDTFGQKGKARNIPDQQAMAGRYLNAFFVSLGAGKGFQPLFPALGTIFRSSVRAEDLTSCYYYTEPEGGLSCFPLLSELPRPEVFNLKFSEETVRHGESELSLLQIKENTASFLVLCEAHRIRELKSMLKKL